ncbi:ANTAR domain-containing protein [Citreimonas sp.]|uniref:ANTAR domain-containing protein n=1 Tax=Citreimonas sp. TaxID=3036715 RepID=UPI004059CB89
MTYSFAGLQACVLHPSSEIRERVSLRLASLGVRAEGRWPTLTPEDSAADLLVIDIDRGEDGQFPWQPGAAPMPVVGLVGSETPGRLQWAIGQDVDAFLPLGVTANLFSALVIASARRAERDARRRGAAEADRRNGLRLDVIRAVTVIMRSEDIDEAAALKRLRAFAMVERLPLEDAATRLLSDSGDTRVRA